MFRLLLDVMHCIFRRARVFIFRYRLVFRKKFAIIEV